MRGGLLLSAAFIFLFLPVAMLQWAAAVFVALIIICYIYTELVSRGLKITRVDLTPNTFRFVPQTIRIRISNTQPLPISYLLLSDNPGGMSTVGECVFSISLPGNSSQLLEYIVKSDRRGVYEIGPGLVKFSDPFGFFSRTIAISTTQTVSVFPRIIIPDLKILPGIPIGELNIVNPLFEDTSRYRGIREYVPGDDPRRIHWKTSAKAENLHVMEFDATYDAPVLLVLNIDASSYTKNTRYQHFERIIEAAASASQLWDSHNQKTGFIINGSQPFILPQVKHQISYILQVLAQIDAPDPSPSEIDVLLRSFPINYGSRIILISPPIKSTYYEQIALTVPPACSFDYWMLEGRISRENYLRQNYISPIKRHRIQPISEYGNRLFTYG